MATAARKRRLTRSPDRIAALIFGALIVAAIAAVAAAYSLGEAAGQTALDRTRLWSGLGFALLLILGAGWLAIRHFLLRPIARIGRELELAAQLGGARNAPAAELPELGAVSDGGALLIERYRGLRRELAAAGEEAAARLDAEKRRLEAILLDLNEGVLVCNLDHQILLYNRAAARIMGASSDIGLGRSLFGFVTREPVLHTLELLAAQAAGPDGTAEDSTAAFVVGTIDARRLMRGRIGLILGAAGTRDGYVLSLADASAEIGDLAEREALLRAATEGLRGPVANIRAGAELLETIGSQDTAARAAFDAALVTESTKLSERLEALSGQYRALSGGPWPVEDFYSADLIGCAARHLKDGSGLVLTMIGIPLWMRGDSHALLLLLERIAERVAASAGLRTLDVEPLLADRRVYLELRWPGPAIGAGEIESWLDAPLPGALGGANLRQVLERHGSEAWSFADGAEAVLRFPVPAPHRPQFQSRRSALPARPEFYDFDLMARSRDAPGMDRPLSALDYVVFDTETTGLDPDGGDEIVSIGAVRIVNLRLLTGETFERIVNPGRSIPPASTVFHGITDTMVVGRPPIVVVLPQFQRFAQNSVLVAHNAAFDMRFLLKHEAEAGLRFDNPVLDTLLLAGAVLDDMPEHSLNSVAKRLGVEILQRHSALGDAMATAALFLHLVELLGARGITTLGQARSAAGGIAALRKRRMPA